MTKQQFIELLKSPSTLDLSAVSGLEEISKQYPYFQNAHLLLAKQYHGHQSIKYDSYLRKAAAYAPDREVLLHLIQTPVTQEIHLESPVSTVDTQPEVSNTEVPSDDTIQDHTFKTGELNDTPSVDSAVSDTEEVEHDRLADIIAERLNEIEKSHDSTEVIIEEDKSEEVVEVDTFYSETQSENNLTGEQDVDLDEVQSNEQLEPEANIQVPASKTVNDEKHESGNETHSFLDWLKSRSIPVIPSEQIGERFGEMTDKVEAQNESDKPEDQIINKFIVSEPRIVPARAEFYSPVNMARKSVQYHDDLVSETLASIYAQQASYDKAIDAYQKLSLKFPEKSSYFAGLIKDLEAKSKEEK